MRRSLRATAAIALVIAAGAIPFAAVLFRKVDTATDANCARLHRLVVAGERILDTPANLRDAYDRGELTRKQYESTLADIHRFDPLREQNIAIWRSADCKV